MPDRSVEAFVEKLALLEERVGHKAQYRVMSPIASSLQDLPSIWKAAKQIADFIGLGDYAFIVDTVKQKEHIGGHIDLSTNDMIVFIEIDPGMLKFPYSVAATLCHEVCHKYLQVNGLRLPLEIENEILTDITTVLLGFGKRMLNGREARHVGHETTADSTQTVTQTMTVGYLDRDQLALVYRLVCAMRRISPSDFMQGLNPEAAVAVRRCDYLYGHHFDAGFHRVEAKQQLVRGLIDRLVEAQRTMGILNRHSTYVKRSLCDTVDRFFAEGHTALESIRQRAIATMQDSGPDPALRYLLAVRCGFAVQRLIDEQRSVSEEAEEMLRHAREVGRHLCRSQRFPAPAPGMFSVVTCPKDGTNVRLPENSGSVIATCPVCRYSFAYDTTAVSFSEPAGKRGVGWRQKIRNLLKR